MYERRQERGMDRIKKIFNKNYVAKVIDMIYGITSTYVGVFGTFYLFELFPYHPIRNIWGHMPKGFMNEFLLSGTFLIVLCHSLKKSLLSVYEIIFGSILATVSINVIPVITFRRVLMTFCCFLILKLIIISFTKSFSVSTRHFGYFIKTDYYNEAISKEL
jgi:hypothetical protein